jgi:ABC-type histidine transport system ATPase subunit
VTSDSFLDVAGAEKAFGGVTVLGGIDLQVAAGEFISLRTRTRRIRSATRTTHCCR